MKPTTLFVSALATLAAAAPTGAEKEVEKRGFNFDSKSFGDFKNFGQSVNLNYMLDINNLDLGILQLLASQNNLNIDGFSSLFSLGSQQFQLQDILLLQQLADLQQFAQIGVLNAFDLTGFNFGGINNIGGILNTGLLGLGGVDLNAFVQPSVLTQVQTIASQVLVVKE
jgi:hypothetical protein